MADNKVGHHPNLPEHRTMGEALKSSSVFLEMYKGAPGVDIADAVQAAAVIVDYGSSMFHSGVSAKSALSEDQAMAHLEDFVAAGNTEGSTVKAAAFPWELIVPVVLDLIRRWLERRK